MATKKIVAVLMGGPSSEREISLRSGRAVCEALKGTEYEPVAIDTVDEWLDELSSIKPQVAFIALHGKFGEDGTVQALLEELKMPYTGSGVQASRLAMDKASSVKIFKAAGIPTPEYMIARKPSCQMTNNKIDFPVVVKPSSQGSSIGLTIVEDRSQLKKAMDLAYVFDEHILVEKFIRGEELTVGILDDNPLPVIKIIPNRKFYDYKAKYLSVETQYLAPAPIEKKFYKKAQALALAAHNALGCKDFSRVDMILGEDGLIKVLEVNSIPGLTSKSLLPKAAACIGINFQQLCIRIIQSAIRRCQEEEIISANIAPEE
jgi:D-alanine-D-alanine ligase